MIEVFWYCFLNTVIHLPYSLTKNLYSLVNPDNLNLEFGHPLGPTEDGDRKYEHLKNIDNWSGVLVVCTRDFLKRTVTMEGTLISKEIKEENFPAVKKYYIIKVERMHLVSSRVNDSRQFFFPLKFYILIWRKEKGIFKHIRIQSIHRTYPILLVFYNKKCKMKKKSKI